MTHDDLQDGEFEIMRSGDMQRKYGLYAENRPVIHLEPERVPVALRYLIPLAERFGISDDLIRLDYLAKTPREELDKMRLAVRVEADALDEWLAGPEAVGPTFTEEYIGFTCLRIAADEC